MAARRHQDEVKFAPIVLAILGGMFVLGVVGQVIGKYVADELPAPPPMSSEPRKPAEAQKTSEPPAPQPAAAAKTEGQTTAPAPASSTLPALADLALPGGSKIAVAPDGVESRLVSFITDSSAVIDKGTWFDFDRLNFETGSATLTTDSKAQIENIAAIMRAFPAVKIKIGGYTDNTGSAEANQKLSDARAKAVVEALVGLGLPADRLDSEGYGDQHPIADNATDEGRAKNRRIAVSVREK